MRRNLRTKIAYYIKLNSLGMKREREKIENITLRIKETQIELDKRTENTIELTEELYWLKAELDLYYDNLYRYETNGKYYENFIW